MTPLGGLLPSISVLPQLFDPTSLSDWGGVVQFLLECVAAAIYYVVVIFWHEPLALLLLLAGRFFFGQYRDYKRDDEAYKRKLERQYPQSTPPEERASRIKQVVDTAVDSAESSRRPAAPGRRVIVGPCGEVPRRKSPSAPPPEKAAPPENEPPVKGGDVAPHNDLFPTVPSTSEVAAVSATFDRLAQGDPNVYTQARERAAKVDADIRLAAFAQVQIGRMHEAVMAIFAEVLTDTLIKKNSITDPEGREYMEKFAKDMLDQTRAGLGGTARTAMRHIDDILSEPYRPPMPTPPGFWAWFLGIR